MNVYRVRLVGDTAWQDIDAHSPTDAVAEAAGCPWEAVCLPIWTTAAGSCYMPRDDSGRQWLVGEVFA